MNAVFPDRAEVFVPLGIDVQVPLAAVKGHRREGAHLVPRLARHLGALEHNFARTAIGEHIDDGDLHRKTPFRPLDS